MKRVRFKDNPNVFVKVTDAEYFRLAEDGLLIKPYDPDRESPPWPDMSGTYVQAPDVGVNRHQQIFEEE